MDLPGGRYGRPALRIGDEERESAARALGDHYTAGRLDRAELDERLGAAYAAKTAAELSRLFADLPDTRDRAVAVRPATARRRRPGPPLWVLPVLIVLASVLTHALIAARHGGRGYAGPPPFLFFLLAWVLLARRRRAWR